LDSGRLLRIHSDRLLHKDLTYKIIGILYRVHTNLGCGFTEKIYQRAIGIEPKKENLSYETEKEFEIKYEGQVIGRYRLDLVIENKVILELKAVERIPKIYQEQLISQLKASPYVVGLLVNFGAAKLNYMRFVRSKPVEK
jgi:GxxExxY protein